MNTKSVKKSIILNVLRQLSMVIFPMISFPYASRLLGSDAYGQFSFAQSIVSYFYVIGSLGTGVYEIREGAGLKNDPGQFKEFCSELFSIHVFTAIVMESALLVLTALVPKLRSYSALIVVGSMAIPLSALGMDWINQIQEDFLYLTVRQFVTQGLALAGLFLLVRAPEDVLRFSMLGLLGTYGGNLLNLFYDRRYVIVGLRRAQTWKKHIRPLMIILLTSVATTIYVSSDITMLGFCLSDASVGIYSFVSKVYNLVKLLIYAVIVGGMPRIAYLFHNQKNAYMEEAQKLFSAVCVILFPAAGGMAALRKPFITIIGGAQFADGSGPLLILSLALIPAIIGAWFANAILILNHQEGECLKATVVSAFINILFNRMAIPLWGIQGAAMTTLIAETTGCLVKMHTASRYFKMRKSIEKEIISYMLGTLTVVVICCAANDWFRSSVIRLCAAVIASATAYAIILWLFENPILCQIFRYKKIKTEK
ncbi:MAG: flippase [Clostridia bacterium]|nr:flippase [Clostridia bacterium]